LSDRLPVRLGEAPEDRMDDVRAVLDAVDSSSAWLFATADGTPIAILAAASDPQRVCGLVLYASSTRLTAAEGYEVGTPPERAERVVARLATSWGDDESGGWDCADGAQRGRGPPLADKHGPH
jgi:pimeloyl-ACP methyl ester carboxylesterase